ncbi:fungal specific transcription factor domain-containing protein [Sarocladium implicatum]|nr:fungal specific transcription factor domain-containing protein [Sarocladium implicatum]
MSVSTNPTRSPGDTASSDHELQHVSAPTSITEEAPDEHYEPFRAEKKRRRPALACEQCRKRKVRCDRVRPCCGPCEKAKVTNCHYVPTHTPAQRAKKAPGAGIQKQYEIRPAPPRTEATEGQIRLCGEPAIESRSSVASSKHAAFTEESHDVEWLVEKVRSLQERLDGVNKTHETDENLVRRYAGQPTLQHQEKGTIVKTRYYGRGHFLHGAWLFPMELGLLWQAENKKDEVYWNLARCKDLARKIKESRPQPLLSTNLGRSIPARALADQLIERYIRAFEGPMRILHIPTFRAEYERYWQQQDAASTSFVMQLQLCLALGASLHDDTFTLRQSAVQWIYEAQMWLMLPPEKDRLTYQGLQIACLISLARSVCAVGSDLTWLGAGSLMRMALLMGLHRDPRQLGNMTVYRAEMRRRLWATVIELDVQFGFDAASLPLVDRTNYDTLPPANVNDDQMSDLPDRDRIGAPGLDVPTQASVQIAMQQSIPLRLAILRHINAIRGEDTYTATLNLNSSLTKACRLLTKTLTDLKSASAKIARSSPDDEGPIRPFHVNMAELALYRCFHHMHQPIIMRSLEDPHFYFSRKMYLDGGIKIAQILKLLPTRDNADPTPKTPSDIDLDRMKRNTTGMIRNLFGQAMMGIGLRLIHLKEEQSHSMGYFPTGFEHGIGGKDLEDYLGRVLELCRQRIRSGETGVKMLCFTGAALARHTTTEKGLEISAVHEAIMEATKVQSRESLHLLKERAAFEGTPLSASDLEAHGEPAEVHESHNWGLGENPSIFNSLQAFGGGYGGGAMDWMTDWAWDDMSNLGWPAGQQQLMPSISSPGQGDLSGGLTL